jgi:hypothetical protein
VGQGRNEAGQAAEHAADNTVAASLAEPTIPTLCQNVDPDDQSESEPESMESAVDSAHTPQLWPACWTSSQHRYFAAQYPGLNPSNGSLGCSVCKQVGQTAGPHRSKGMAAGLAAEWVNGTVSGVGVNKHKQQKHLRKKIKKHNESSGHITAQKTVADAEMEVLPGIVSEQTKQEHVATCRVFRTAYYIAKHDRPFTDHPDLVDLQQQNGLSMGRVLHSNVICADIVDHVAHDMRKKLLDLVIKSKAVMSVLIDESTSLSQNTCLIIYIRCAINQTEEPVTIFFRYY